MMENRRTMEERMQAELSKKEHSDALVRKLEQEEQMLIQRLQQTQMK